MTQPLTIHIMTAAMTPGDAIGNYILTSARIWRSWGAKVEIYADTIAPVYGGLAKPSSFYQPTGTAVLWFHYSIFADNVDIALNSNDYTIMDYHGISPARLFTGRDEHLAQLCQQGIDLLPKMAGSFDQHVVHSDYMVQELTANGYGATTIHKLPLCLDTARFEGQADAELAADLTRLEYGLFIGRVVPQKDILGLLEIFRHIQQRRPNFVLVLVGGRHMTPAYQRQIDQFIARHNLGDRIIFTGQVNNTAVLAEFLRQARFLFVTSEWESFCVPLAEAMYFGVPPVIHDLPPLPEIAGEAGVVIDKRQPQAAAQAVVALLQDDAAYQARRAAATARSGAYTDQALADSLLAMLREVFNA